MAEMNPQRQLFKEFFCDPTSDSFGIINKSALKAGFSESYANVLMSESTDNDWVKNIIKDYKMLTKAEDRLNEALDIPISDKELGERSLKASMFVAETLGKNKYSKRNELTGKNGEQLIPLAGFEYVKPNKTEDNSTT